MKTKLKPIRWYRTIEKWNWTDNEVEYRRAIYQPGDGWRPVTDRYFRQRSRFIKRT